MRQRRSMVALVACMAMTTNAHATFHLMQIEQVVAGVGGNPAAQAIQLRTRATLQNILSEARLIARDANGANPVLLIDFTTDVNDEGTGMRILVVSPSMVGSTIPAVAADYTLAAAIPASYLAGGSLTFESDLGTIYWRLSWGNYTGPMTGAVTNDLDGQFGPPFAGPLPSWNQGLRFQGTATARSTNNLADYALTPGAAVLTNSTGANFTVSLPTDTSPQFQFVPLSNWPNPFNPSTEIVFSRAHPGVVALRIFDAQGRVVTTLVDGAVPAGQQRYSWNGMDHHGQPVASGAYVAQLWSLEGVESRKLLLLK